MKTEYVKLEKEKNKKCVFKLKDAEGLEEKYN